MRRILFEQTDFNTLPNPPAGFQYIGFNGPTFSQKDNNGDTTQPGGATELVELTSSEAIDLLSGQGVVEGTRYLITGFDVELYGGTDILVTGLPNNQFSINGYGKFYNPRYSIGIWNPITVSYSVDDVVIYGGKVWKNLTGSVGSTDGIFSLDGTNWEIQDDYSNIDHYFIQWDQVELGFADNDYCINSRYDSFRNNYVRIGQLDGGGSDRWFFCGVNPISAFGWGNDNINDCNIKDSYFNCLNIIGTTTIYGVEMSNYSYLFNCSFRDSQIEALIFNNESGSYGLSLNNSYFKNCKFENNSTIDGNFNDSSTIEYLNLSNNSYVNNLTFYSSYFQNLNMTNNSTITYISASSSYFQNLNMTNNSWISNIELTIGGAGNSYFERVDLSNRSYIQNVDLYDSSMYEIKLDNYSYIGGNPAIDLWNSSINYINFNNHSRMYGNIGLSSSYFKRIDMTNRSVIEGEIDFVNSHLEKIDATNDSLINNLYFSNDSDNPGTRIENLNMNGSYLQDINLNNSSIFAPNLDISLFSNLTGDDLTLMGYDLNLSSLNFISLGTVSNLAPLASIKFNEYKYISVIEMNGSNGYGLIDSPLYIGTMLVPEGSYIERLSINCSELVYSGDSATFSFGIWGLSPLELLVSDISNKVKIFDISNDLLDGSKSLADTILSAGLSGGTNITSGTIYLEITLKISLN